MGTSFSHFEAQSHREKTGSEKHGLLAHFAYCLPVPLTVFWGAEAVEKQFMCK